MTRPSIQKPFVSVVITILNESRSINALLTALQNQTLPPNEVIIVDGGSSDDSLQKIQNWQKKFGATSKIAWTILSQTGNRSVGRNVGIKAAKNDLIAITDAGCIPRSNWLEELFTASQKFFSLKHGQLQPFALAGYYSSRVGSALEEAVVPYVLVMPDQVNPNDFLPATRSMMLSKSAWKLAGKFDERLRDNEDYAFAHALRNAKIPMDFTQKAVVEWVPRNSLQSFAWMIFRFARGDFFAGIIRPKVLFIFVRYLAGLLFTLLGIWLGYAKGVLLLDFMGLALYLTWAVFKNKRYVPNGWYWLPVLQVIADFAVMSGSLVGGWQRLTTPEENRV